MPAAARIRLSDVAAAAGVSITTASRALSGRGDLTPATRRSVLRAAQALGYKKTERAGGRPRAATRLFDLVLGRFHDAYADEVTAGARGAAAEHGYDLVLTAERETPVDDWPSRIRRRGSAGVILGVITPTTTQLRLLTEAKIPLIVVDPRSDSDLTIARVHTTDAEGAAGAARHLLNTGATRFLAIGGAPSYRYGRARVAAFSEGIRAERPEASLVQVTSEWNARSAYAACLASVRGLPAGERLGVFACSDEMAAGVYAAAAATGKTIGSDIMLVGFDDVRAARWMTPPLSTVHQPIREMAAAAVHALAAHATGKPLPTAPIVLPTRLVVRGSAP